MKTKLQKLFRRYWPWARIRRLEAALDAATDLGIYPKSIIGGDDAREKRTEYMEGWNDAQQEAITAVLKVLADEPTHKHHKGPNHSSLNLP